MAVTATTRTTRTTPAVKKVVKATRTAPVKKEATTGPVVSASAGDVPDFNTLGRFPRYLGITTRTKDRIADIVERPVKVGTVVSPALILADVKQVENLRRTMTDKEDAGIYPINDSLVCLFLGVTKAKSTDWIVGTDGPTLKIMRVSAKGGLAFRTMAVDAMAVEYALGTEFDVKGFRYWEIDTPEKAAERLAKIEAVEARAEKRAAKEAEAAADTTKPRTAKKIVKAPVAKKVPVAKAVEAVEPEVAVTPAPRKRGKKVTLPA